MRFNNQESSSDTLTNDEGFDIKKILSKVINYWYLFLISLLVFSGLAFLYTQYTTPTYNISSEITVDDQSSLPGGGKGMSSSATMDFSDILGMPSNAYNEMDILKTKILMTKVVKSLNLNVITFRKQKLKAVELYKESPFDVQVINKKDSIELRSFDVNINKNSVHVVNSDEDLDVTVAFGQIVKTEQFDLVFTRNLRNKVSESGYKLIVESIDSKVENLSKGLTIDLTDKKSSTLAINFDYPNPEKGEAILQKLMDLYLRSNLDNKKEIADSTLSFIDARLAIVSNQLTGVESQFANFKQKNNITDVDAQGQALVDNVSDYYQKLNEQEVQLSILNDISKYLNNPANKRIIPSSLTVPDPVFAAGIGMYNQLLIQRDQLYLSYKDSNPILQNLNQSIETARQSLVNSFEAYKKNILMSIDAIKRQNTKLNAEVRGVPKKQRTFMDFSREQDLRQQLYLFLLQKREETAISETSTLSTARIIDPAKSDYKPYKPKKYIILLFGAVIGLVLPWAYLNLRDLINVRISSKEDVISNTKVSILGEIGNNPETSSLSVIQNSRSILSEQFRSLRTNLQFVLDNDKPNVIMLTSSMSGEGKSFIALNLASVLALGDKRVVVMELDLRKPKLSENAGVDSSIGFTNYVVSSSLQTADILKPTAFSENVYIIPAGPIPPNPAELLLNKRLEILINNLKSEFDYVIIDSAPIGLVADAQLIETHCDVCLYVARQNYTYKAQLGILNDLVLEQKFRHAYLVINDIKNRKGGYYGSGYGYSYGSYDDNQK